MKAMKFKVLRLLAQFKNWENTERGERIIVRFWGVVSTIGAIDLALLIIGICYE